MATRKPRPSFLYLGGGEMGSTPVITSSNDFGFELDEADIWNSSPGALNDHKKFTTLLHGSKSSRKLPKGRSSNSSSSSNHRHDHDMYGVTGKSLPVNVPDWSKILRGEYKQHEVDIFDDNFDFADDDNDDNRLPPHEYLARTRIASFSVQEGVGRTLKGRDLSRVRNAIWKQTGFED